VADDCSHVVYKKYVEFEPFSTAMDQIKRGCDYNMFKDLKLEISRRF